MSESLMLFRETDKALRRDQYTIRYFANTRASRFERDQSVRDRCMLVEKDSKTCESERKRRKPDQLNR